MLDEILDRDLIAFPAIGRRRAAQKNRRCSRARTLASAIASMADAAIKRSNANSSPRTSTHSKWRAQRKKEEKEEKTAPAPPAP
jgi:hypothetical protein